MHEQRFTNKKTEWSNLKTGAGNETRTRDPNLGKVMLYQLSYSRLYMVSPRGVEPLLPP